VSIVEETLAHKGLLEYGRISQSSNVGILTDGTTGSKIKIVPSVRALTNECAPV
jgi:hypothetical protein